MGEVVISVDAENTSSIILGHCKTQLNYCLYFEDVKALPLNLAKEQQYGIYLVKIRVYLWPVTKQSDISEKLMKYPIHTTCTPNFCSAGIKYPGKKIWNIF